MCSVRRGLLKLQPSSKILPNDLEISGNDFDLKKFENLKKM